jgi:hypothetical protein
MNLNEYEDEYAPRPRASQEVAAAKRQQDTVSTTPPARSVRNTVPLGVGALLIILSMVGMMTYQLAQAPAKPLALTPSPSVISAPVVQLAAPTAAPTSTPAMESYIIDAFAAPNGVVLGPVDLGSEVVQAVARAGVAWVQLQRPSGDRVWFKRSDLPANLSVPATLPDLSPRTAAPAPQAGRGQGLTNNNGWTPPEATAEPAAAPPPVETNEKPAPDRAARYATAVARSNLPPPARTSEKESK